MKIYFELSSIKKYGHLTENTTHLSKAKLASYLRILSVIEISVWVIFK